MYEGNQIHNPFRNGTEEAEEKRKTNTENQTRLYYKLKMGFWSKGSKEKMSKNLSNSFHNYFSTFCSRTFRYIH
jgi:hypothetical protein